MTESETTDEDGDTGKDGIEQIKGTHSADADEVEECPLHAQIGERFMQALEDSICATFRLCLVGHVVFL